MKYILLIIVLFSTPAYADEGWFSWDRNNTLLHIPLTASMIIDMGQTLDIKNHEKIWCKEYYFDDCTRTIKAPDIHETNPFLGAYPEDHEIYAYFIASYIAVTALTYVLPERWSHALQGGVIGIEIGYIDHNYRAGLKVRF